MTLNPKEPCDSTISGKKYAILINSNWKTHKSKFALKLHTVWRTILIWLSRNRRSRGCAASRTSILKFRFYLITKIWSLFISSCRSIVFTSKTKIKVQKKHWTRNNVLTKKYQKAYNHFELAHSKGENQKKASVKRVRCHLTFLLLFALKISIWFYLHTFL